jgi:MFS family permease
MLQKKDDSNESPTIVTVPTESHDGPRRIVVGRFNFLRQGTSAFRHHNYRLFFFGQLVSLVGTWMQVVAESWLVYQLSNSTFILGLMRFLSSIPVTLLSVIAGAIADRHNKRRILILTTIFSMVPAIILAVLVYFGWVKLWHVGLLAVCLGIANAFDIPTRQSFVIEMVGKEDLTNAIALNSSMFNAARVFGPALAGIMISIAGIAGCFLINGLSFIAVLIAYAKMDFPEKKHTPIHSQSIFASSMEALRYAAENPSILANLILVAIVSFFGISYSTLMPVFARDLFQLDATGYGYLLAANGIGALIGAVILASIGTSISRRLLVFTGLFGFCATLFILAISKVLWLSIAALTVGGCFMIIYFATSNTALQLRTPDVLRGRIMGLYSFAFIGISPFGSLVTGAMAKRLGTPTTVAIGAAICTIAGVLTMIITASNARSQKSN